MAACTAGSCRGRYHTARGPPLPRGCGQSAFEHGEQHQGDGGDGEHAVARNDRHGKPPFGREAEVRRQAPGPDSAAANAWWTGIHRVNMVRPSEAMTARIPTAAQPCVLACDSRWITQNTTPVRANRTCPKMTGVGSRLAGAPSPVTSYSTSQTASRYTRRTP